MDTDNARCASEEIYRQIRQQARLSRSGSVRDITLQPEPLGVMTQGRLNLCRRETDQPQTAQTNVRDQPGRDTELTMGVTGGHTVEYTSMFYG